MENVREIFGLDDFPQWLREAAMDWTINNREALNDRGISTKSITYGAAIKPSGNVATVSIYTSLGVIPFRAVRPHGPQEGPQTAV